MLLCVQAFPDDATRREHGQIRHLLAQILDGFISLLLDLGARRGDQALRLLASLGLEFFAQVLTLLCNAVEQGLPLAPRRFHPELVLLLRRLAILPRLLRRAQAVLNPLRAGLEDLHDRLVEVTPD